MSDRLRVDRLSICIIYSKGGKQDVIYEEDFDPNPFTGFGPEELFELKREINKSYEIKPSFEYLCTRVEEIEGGPDGVRHTMDQIQNWYHFRYKDPWSPECASCGQVKAKHGPSHSCKQFKEKI